MNKLGNTLKFVSGIILFVIGVVISYEVMVYNLVDVLLMVGFLIAIVGIILIISYFVDSNAEKTSGLIKDFLNSGEFNKSSINFPKRNSKSNSDFDNNGPLIMRPEHDDYDYGKNIDDYHINVLCQPEPGVDYEASIVDIKPYLRPMSSMTEEEKNEHFGRTMTIDIVETSQQVIDWLLKHHFDYRGLIPMGLALEAPEGMYKTK